MRFPSSLGRAGSPPGPTFTSLPGISGPAVDRASASLLQRSGGEERPAASAREPSAPAQEYHRPMDGARPANVRWLRSGAGLRAWLSRIRWRRRGAWLWPSVLAFTVIDAIVGHALPPQGESE